MTPPYGLAKRVSGPQKNKMLSIKLYLVLLISFILSASLSLAEESFPPEPMPDWIPVGPTGGVVYGDVPPAGFIPDNFAFEITNSLPTDFNETPQENQTIYEEPTEEIGSSECVNFTYSSWSKCQEGGFQSRTILSAYPENCVGGTRVIRQSCKFIEDETNIPEEKKMNPIAVFFCKIGKIFNGKLVCE